MTEPGVFRLGDQAAVIPSLAGEGMGIALASGFAAATAFVGGESAANFQKLFARRAAQPLRIAGAVRAAGEHSWSAPLLLGGMRIAPALAPVVARLTRIRV